MSAGRHHMKPLRSWHWLVALVLAGLLAAPCIGLALREMERHQEARAVAVSVESSLRAPPIALDRMRSHIQPYRRLVVRGSYDYAHEVLIQEREHAGQPGFYVVTPLRVEDGAYLVLRGWVPAGSDGMPERAEVREARDVAVEGFSLPGDAAALGEEPSALAHADSWPLRVSTLRVSELADRLPYPVQRLVLQQLPSADLPKRPLRLPSPNFDSPHETHANLWYVAAAVLAGLPLAGLALLGRRP